MAAGSWRVAKRGVAVAASAARRKAVVLASMMVGEIVRGSLKLRCEKR